ncbi:hypothetical protein CDAR_312781 [Caerostris darwini]|uniref:Uncharacterized protein n=1 Tax=Caerostris darwini TaxID=1538125 RepID=A0AAV4MRB5_9ARAC|nr:hypothetical protein CDAR_312781 [Caerostris darwini]
MRNPPRNLNNYSNQRHKKRVQPAPTQVICGSCKKQQTTVILAPKDKGQSVKDMRSTLVAAKNQGRTGRCKKSHIDNNLTNYKNKRLMKDKPKNCKETIEKEHRTQKGYNGFRTPPEQKAKIICYGIQEGTTEQDLIEALTGY